MNGTQRENPDEYRAAPRRARGCDEHQDRSIRSMFGRWRYFGRERSTKPRRLPIAMTVRNHMNVTGRPARNIDWITVRNLRHEVGWAGNELD